MTAPSSGGPDMTGHDPLAEPMLVWADSDQPEFDVAAVFDFADPVRGPGFAPDHAVVDDPDEREQMLAYLRGGAVVLMTTAVMDDILDPAAGAVVPANFRTDGEWIWADSTEYYLSRYGLAPDAALAGHIRAKLSLGEVVPVVDDEAADRAANFLLHTAAAEPEETTWFPAGPFEGNTE